MIKNIQKKEKQLPRMVVVHIWSATLKNKLPQKILTKINNKIKTNFTA